VLSQKPTIKTTMTSLPPALLEQLLSEMSTLASVYHKPPESFVGKGRFGADEIQRAAIREQRENAADNPIAASVAAVTNGGNGQATQNNTENLLDIDFDGAAPASQEANSATATPDRIASPASGAPSGGMADMMSMFDAPPPSSNGGGGAPMSPSAGVGGGGGGGMSDMMNGFEGLNFGGQQSTAPLPAAMQLQQGAQSGQQPPGPKKDSDDLLGLL
jgi:AP-1 complex subunit beta-1